jgi:hypothetical protein
VKNRDTAEKVFTPQRQRDVSRNENRGTTKASYTATIPALLEKAMEAGNRGAYLVCRSN